MSTDSCITIIAARKFILLILFIIIWRIKIFIFIFELILLIEKRFISNCNILKFSAVMNMKEQSKLRKLCKFIRIINEKMDSL